MALASSPCFFWSWAAFATPTWAGSRLHHPPAAAGSGGNRQFGSTHKSGCLASEAMKGGRWTATAKHDSAAWGMPGGAAQGAPGQVCFAWLNSQSARHPSDQGDLPAGVSSRPGQLCWPHLLPASPAQWRWPVACKAQRRPTSITWWAFLLLFAAHATKGSDMRVQSDDRYQGPRPVPDPPGEDATAMGCLGLAVAVVVSIAFWYFLWHLLRWVF